MKRNEFLFVKSTHQSLLRSGAPHHKSYFMHTNTRYTCPINPHLPIFYSILYTIHLFQFLISLWTYTISKHHSNNFTHIYIHFKQVYTEEQNTINGYMTI
ncbi:hypothetical protein Hanom_Chr03g00225681 [Helianthus anomalus]